MDAAAKNGMDVDVEEPVLALPSLPDEREDKKTAADEDDNDFGKIQEEDGTAVGSVNEVTTTMLLMTPVPQRISIKMRAGIIIVEARCIDQDDDGDAVIGFIILFLFTYSYHHLHR